MKPNFDDPRLTAYALGELDQSEIPTVEALLAESAEARQWVDEVRQTAQELEGGLAEEPSPSLSAEQRRAINARLAPRPKGLWQTILEFAQPRLTVVECLVLLGILGIMAAMLLPALAPAKARSKRLAASSALRQYALEQQFQRKNELMALQPRSDEPPGQFNTESYAHLSDNPFLAVAEDPLSTFSIDVDTTSYSIVRRFVNEGRLPPKDAVRIEEMINYFSYTYPQPEGEDPFSVNIEIAGCPWNAAHRLMRVGLKGREIPRTQRPPSNLVFLVDVSGSMQPANKLPLLKESLKLLVRQLSATDRVTLIVYAGAAGEVLPPTPGSQQRKIVRALESLEAGGSTHGSQGIQLAYEEATANFIPGGVNRVILCTDGDFNVGITSPGDLVRLIEDKARTGVFLTVLGFGMGNYKDSNVEMLADKGNGNYAYIDTLNEGQKVLVDQMSGTLVTIAKDVKIQVEFNPARVSAYRLIGYENRVLHKEDFNNDKKDAGEIGAGHTVTALYELVPVGAAVNAPAVDPLKYQKPGALSSAAASQELLTLKLRYKQPEGETSKLITVPVSDRGIRFANASSDFKFASAVAAFGMILRDSPYKGTASLDGVHEIAAESVGPDLEGYRTEFLTLIQKAAQLHER